MRALPPPAWRTAERRTLLRAVREEWLQAALRPAPADRAAEAGVRMAYAQAGLPAPKAVVWLDSPWAGVLDEARALTMEAPGSRPTTGSHRRPEGW